MAGGRKRPRNDSNLVDALHKLLTGKQMSVTDAAEAVQKAGYQTSAANFRTIVNQTLIKFRSRFKKVSRGVYTATFWACTPRVVAMARQEVSTIRNMGGGFGRTTIVRRRSYRPAPEGAGRARNASYTRCIGRPITV